MIWPYASGTRPDRPLALIDRRLPKGAFMLEHHDIYVRVPPADAFAAATALSLSDLPLVRLLFVLRGIPFRSEMSLRDFFTTEPFLLLDEEPHTEIVFGIVGPFWSLRRGHMPPEIPQSPAAFSEALNSGRMAAVGNLRVEAGGGGSARLWTETWVSAPGAASAALFAGYWMAIGPWSALIRKRLLNAAAGSMARDRKKFQLTGKNYRPG